MKKIQEENSQLQIKLEEMITDGKLTKEDIRKDRHLFKLFKLKMLKIVKLSNN